MISRDAKLTTRQRSVLLELSFRDRIAARDLGVRSDVLWRMEERGLVARNLHEQWYITARGRDVLPDA